MLPTRKAADIQSALSALEHGSIVVRRGDQLVWRVYTDHGELEAHLQLRVVYRRTRKVEA